MTPGTLVRWKGCSPTQWGRVLAVLKAGSLDVLTCGSGGGLRRRFANRLRGGYELFLRPLNDKERASLVELGWLKTEDSGSLPSTCPPEENQRG